VNLVGDAQHCDVTLITNHAMGHATSSQNFRTVLKGKAKGVFQGRIDVARHAQKTEAHQLNKALLLTDGAEMNAKPELRIYADDVQCSHGATTGQIDDKALFYLMSRGIPLEEAQKLMVTAFTSELLELMADEMVKDMYQKEIDQWLS
jgi:Fe-S cluster assembly protein SufD